MESEQTTYPLGNDVTKVNADAERDE